MQQPTDPFTFKPAASSTVIAASYDQARQVLRVEYKYGTYHYAGVPIELWEDLKIAPSAGSFLHQHVKGKFDFTKDQPEGDTYSPNVPE